MWDIRSYYRAENEAARKSYLGTLEKIRVVKSDLEPRSKSGPRAAYFRMLASAADTILRAAEMEKAYGQEHCAECTLAELAAENGSFFEEVLPRRYGKSFANPSYCIEVFGEKYGQMLSVYYSLFRQYFAHAARHKIFLMEKYNRLFLEMAAYVLSSRKPDYGALCEIALRNERNIAPSDSLRELRERFSPDFRFFQNIVEDSDLSDPRYLFEYGFYISKNEIRTAEFLAKYPASRIRGIAEQTLNSYFAGFRRGGKDIASKKLVGIVYTVGRERIVRQLSSLCRERGLEPIPRPQPATHPNRQYNYDHRFSDALYFDSGYAEKSVAASRDAFGRCADFLSQYSGIIHFLQFGEKPFSPELKKNLLNYSPEQQELKQKFLSETRALQEKYIPRKETSFTAIAFPSPEIGPRFPEIFETIRKVNSLDTTEYEKIQDRIIQVLDKADHIHIKGARGNLTDLVVRLADIKNPAKETRFLNCGADVNIPVGEVFTSPRLKGTTGTLHIGKTYLNNLLFKNLKLVFRDGYIAEYSCTNFRDRAENSKYVQQNLMQPHRTLPLGEFAIGTNTLAYAAATKYRITSVLPILIIEKMGPHFAVGDTCFSWSEDTRVFNHLDGKEIIARENEKSANRRKSAAEAYTNRHTDITLPYDAIGHISAVMEDGSRQDIIRNGRFVLKGTEKLNKALDSLRKRK